MSIKSLDKFIDKKYKLSGVFGVHLLQGQVIRNESSFRVFLGTERGIIAFIEENNPFVSIQITDLSTKQAITTQFADRIKYSRSRYNQPLRVSEYR
jgi:hypothetical protein